MAKMKWHRPKPIPRAHTTRQERRLESQADHMLLKSDPKKYPEPKNRINPHYEGALFTHQPDPERPERAYFRSVGSVMQNISTGVWSALDGNGLVIGTFNTRWEAWRCADKLGMERAGTLG